MSRSRWALLALVVSALVGAFLLGRYVGEGDLRTVMDMPTGGLFLSKRTESVWSKFDNNKVSIVRIPNPYQAQMARMFGPSVPMTVTTTTRATTTTTTRPKEQRR